MPYDKTTPKRAGIWENLGTSHADVAQLQKPSKPWLREALTSGEVYRSHLLLAFVVLGALLLIFDALGGFTPHPRPPAPGELDLSGAWKVRIGDGDAFADPGLDDAAWCPLGVPEPLADVGAAAAGCPPPAELLRRMRGAVFWYRRTVDVPEGAAWREPSLYLGEVRARARVYWDGAFVGTAVPEQNPVTLGLEPRQVAAGRHLLAVRFAGGGEERPGLQHGGRRGVVLGELANSLPTGTDRRRLDLAAALWAALLQVVAFAFLLLLTVQARGGYRELLWLAIFFGSTFVYALYHLALEPLAWCLRTLALAGWSMSLLGYGVSLYARDAAVRRRLDLLWLALWLFQVLAVTVAFSLDGLGSRWLAGWRLAATAAPFVVYAGVAVAGGWRRDAGRRESRSVRATLALLLGLYLCHLLDDFAPFSLPGPLGSPFFLPFLSCLVFYFAAESYTDALRSVAFYGRFIRPGLKRLLQQKGRSIFGDEKLFRGRKTVIMKIDMANYTRTTFDMPYGMRRLFQDLWFTLIDQVVADKVFLDKSLGDGSVYCFEDNLPGGSATAALRAALEIRERQVQRFDETYRRHLAEMLRDTPELQGPADVYLERYAQKNGPTLWERSTQIRIALVAGYVDEGLWGLSSQSHYDVQGGPLILATRLEAAAKNGEIVFDDRFREELEEESPGLLDPALLEERTVDLKGIGSWKIWVLPTRVDPFSAPALVRAGTA